MKSLLEWIQISFKIISRKIYRNVLKREGIILYYLFYKQALIISEPSNFKLII